MNKLTADKCRDLIDDLKSHKVAGFRISSTREGYLAALEIALPILEQRERSEGEWIEWGGGECPVPESALVDVKTNGGGEYKNKEARSLCWRHAFINGNIIAYRIIPERATNHNGEQ